MRFLISVFLFAGLALADDATGKWSGTFTPEGRDASGAYLVLKQSGAEVTGTAGPDENQQWTISKGKIDGNKVTAEVTRPEGIVYKLTMILEGDHRKGDVTATLPDGAAIAGKIDLTRVR
jgi:hypothetical protein